MAHLPAVPVFACGLCRSALAASLCVLLITVPVSAQGPSAQPPTHPTEPVTTRLTENQKVLHALNRFTFGPRPGDLADVESTGLDAWFERQLHPAALPDPSASWIEAKFPAMQLSQAKLIERFPSPAMLRQSARNEMLLPADPTERAIYADSMYGYEQKRNATQAEGVVGGGGGGKKRPAAAAGTNATGADAADAAPAAAEKEDTGMQAASTPRVPGGAPQAFAQASQAPGQASQASAQASQAPANRRGKARVTRGDYDGPSVDAVLALPPDGRMAAILGMSPREEIAFRRLVGPAHQRELLAGLSPAQAETLGALQSPVRVVGAEALGSRLMRDVLSDRQLEAVMTDFWLNHFNVYLRKSQNEPFLLPAYERDTIRPHALGRFEDLLVATAESPAMEVYLDNWQSIGPDSVAAARGERLQRLANADPNRPLARVGAAGKPPRGINENYAREIIELHTLGVQCEVSADKPASMLDHSCGGGYTQADVTNLAKVLTGWTVQRPYGGAGLGRGAGGNVGADAFTFNENRHEPGSKQVLGVTIPPGGMNEGLQVLHMLATSPATAQFISHKLCVRFVADNPPRALEDRMAATFLATGGDIKAVLRTLFHSPEFWTPETYRAKVKTPIEFVASALRASGATVDNALPLVQAMDRLGMPVYGMQTPNGYSWDKTEWVSTNSLISRMNFALVMSGDLLPGTRVDWTHMLGEPASAASQVPSPAMEKKLELLLLGQPASPNTRAAVLDQSAKPGQIAEAERSLAAAVPADQEEDDALLLPGKKKKGAGKHGRAAGGQLSMAELSGNTVHDGPLPTMAGLLLGSPEFQRR